MTPPHVSTIRLATLHDVDTLVSFNTAMAQETESRALDRNRVRRGISAMLGSMGKGFYLVAERPHEEQTLIIGQLMVTYEWSDWRNGMFWWIQSVYVAPTWRRRGVYRQMHEWLLQKAKAQPDICGIRLYVESDNQLAQTVYGRVGLVPSGYLVYEEDFVLPKKQ